MDETDVLYKDNFQDIIIEFCRVCSKETTIAELSGLIENLKASEILKYLMTDPANESAKICVRDYLHTHKNVNQDFLSKFLSVVSMKINIMPQNVGFISKSYTAKIIYNNTQPTSKLTNLTVRTKYDELREDAKRAVEYQKNRRVAPQTIKLKFNDDIIQWCLNAISDLNSTIVEGNRANGREMNNFVKTTLK